MRVQPEYKSFGELFNEDNVFETPKYQRDYSWETEQISQFCKDIDEALYHRKKKDQSCEHFFGSIVCAQEEGVGKRKIKNILVDGQQRLSTIILFFAVIKEYLESLELQDEDVKFKETLLSEISKYFVYQERNNRETKKYERITIGNADNIFFHMLVAGTDPKPERDSHKLIFEARKKFKNFIENELFDGKNNSQRLDLIDEIVKIFDESFLLIHIITTNIDDAYKLFMVLNDRGINLTEGELLKAHTLGHYDDQHPLVLQMSKDWDFILSYDSKTVSNYLRWFLIMLTGENITTTNVLQKYRDRYFTQSLEIEKMAANVDFLRKCVEKLNFLSSAEWPYEDDATNAQAWYKNKLEWLINKLKHIHVMPVLLAACFLSEKEFKILVSETCKFFIRYKVISGLHAGVFSPLYSSLAFYIYKNQESYSSIYLLEKFRDIITKKDPENINFSNGIRALRYNRKGDNKPFKYLMIILEENWQWVNNGGSGTSKNRIKDEDKSRIFDFSQTTLEHLYPHNAKDKDYQNELESIKDSIGNLVLLDIRRNGKNDDKSFNEKKENFKNTGIGIHNYLLSKDNWTKSELDELTEIYIKHCCKVFSF